MFIAVALIAGSVDAEIRGGFSSLNSSMQQVPAEAASLLGGIIIQENADGSLQHFNRVGHAAIFICLLSVGIAFWMNICYSPKRS